MSSWYFSLDLFRTDFGQWRDLKEKVEFRDKNLTSLTDFLQLDSQIKDKITAVNENYPISSCFCSEDLKICATVKTKVALKGNILSFFNCCKPFTGPTHMKQKMTQSSMSSLWASEQ